MAARSVRSPSAKDEVRERLKQLQAEQEPLALTLGGEWEGVLAEYTYPDKSEHTRSVINRGFRSRRGIEKVTEVLSQQMEVTCATCSERHLIKVPVRNTGSYAYWAVENDASIDKTKAEEDALGDSIEYTNLYPIEVKSRVFRADKVNQTSQSTTNPDHFHSITWMEEVTAVLKHLDRTFNTKSPMDKSRWRLYTNTTCGMHVHVGNGSRGFPLRTVQNVMSTYLAAEKSIDQLQAWTRIGGTRLPIMPPDTRYMGNIFCFSADAYNRPLSSDHALSVFHRLRGCNNRGDSRSLYTVQSDSLEYPDTYDTNPIINRAAREYTAPAALTLVQWAPSLGAVKDLQVRGGHSSTVNLENLKEFSPSGDRTTKMTIEFRQHGPTFDAAQATAWMSFNLSLVRFAHKVSDLDFGRLKSTFQSRTFGALDLIKAIHCPPLTVKFYRSQLIVPENANSFRSKLRSREERRITAFGPRDPFHALMVLNLRERMDLYDQEKVSDRITEKFMRAGYGQQADDVLDQIDFARFGDDAEARKDQLRVGWVNPNRPSTQPSPQTSSDPETSSSKPSSRDSGSGGIRGASSLNRNPDAEIVDGEVEEGTRAFPLARQTDLPQPSSFTGTRFEDHGATSSTSSSPYLPFARGATGGSEDGR